MKWTPEPEYGFEGRACTEGPTVPAARTALVYPPWELLIKERGLLRACDGLVWGTQTLPLQSV